jgi:hypothetical protein
MAFGNIPGAMGGAAVYIALLVFQGCAHHRVIIAPPEPALDGDSIRILSFDQIGAVTLSPGRSARFSVRVRYTLTSYDRAVLSVDLVQFSNRDSCTSDTGRVIQSAHFAQPITRGTHDVETTLTWPGDTVPVSETGAVSLQSSMGLEQPSYQFLLRSFGTQFCQRF